MKKASAIARIAAAALLLGAAVCDLIAAAQPAASHKK
jgi:hypothetical protein